MHCGYLFCFPTVLVLPCRSYCIQRRRPENSAWIASSLQVTDLFVLKIPVARAHRLRPQQLAVYSALPVRHNLPPKRPVYLVTTALQTLQTPLSLPKLPRYSAASQISSNSSSKQAVVGCLAPTWRPQSQAVYLAAIQLRQATQVVVYLEIQRLQLPSQPRPEEACSVHLRSSPLPQRLEEDCSAASARSQQTTKWRQIQVVYLGKSQPHQQEEACSASLRLPVKACCMFPPLRPCFSKFII